MRGLQASRPYAPARSVSVRTSGAPSDRGDRSSRRHLEAPYLSSSAAPREPGRPEVREQHVRAPPTRHSKRVDGHSTRPALPSTAAVRPDRAPHGREDVATRRAPGRPRP
jgi:hypothetical protein